MPYDPGLSRIIDRIRLVLVDTDGEAEWLPDETYAALLSAGGASSTAVDAATASVARTAAGIIEGIIRKRPVKRTANGEAVDYSGQADFYAGIASGETPLPLLEVAETPPTAPSLTAILGSRTVSTEARF